MTTPIKLAIAGVSVSGVAVGAGVGIHQLVKQPAKKSITKLLSEKNKAIITTGETSKWDPKWTAFKNAHSQNAPTGDWAIDQWETKKGTNDGLNAFKQLCVDNAKKEVENENAQLFKDVKTYCVE
ncbi:hypothetical protein A6V39_03495 [Candidatus Mycoplasma haematobovis]|uniref:Uncharacterized protein n=1 Tax=Candidatus Mycoplasma haematobovis TaxID=432608 RepID=A0A1A9QE35_9MOLU|nr:hypothetical protein [Candidatus Mycoplasma haematobovis]OAL09950.1 hypothetical protein A6V39_03495 [Candidatus Mycoplasma haematobovis]